MNDTGGHSYNQKKEEERIDFLGKKPLKIIQSKAYFAFSTDTLFLVDFMKVRSDNRHVIVDFCTGNGVVPLLLSERTSAQLYGIEIQTKIADLARRSVKLNQLEEQITIIEDNIRNAGQHFNINSIDVISCNPPYFKRYQSSSINPNDHKALARHELAMVVEDIFYQASRLLRGKGKLFLVHRPERLNELIVLGEKYHLALKRLRFVHPKRSTEANTVLVEFHKEGQMKGLKVLPPLIAHDEDNQYSEEVKRILYGEN